LLKGIPQNKFEHPFTLGSFKVGLPSHGILFGKEEFATFMVEDDFYKSPPRCCLIKISGMNAEQVPVPFDFKRKEGQGLQTKLLKEITNWALLARC